MAHNAPLPKAEARVVIRTTGLGWQDMLEIDPIMLPVEDQSPIGRPILTDVYDAPLMRLMDVVVELQADEKTECLLVWSDSYMAVKGCCPGCDDVFIVSEGFVGDADNEGYEAVGCGCYDG